MIGGVTTNFATRSTGLENLKPTFAFLVNPFVVDVVKDGCPVQKPIVTQTANIEAELLDMQQDFALKSGISHSQQWSFGNKFLLTSIQQ